MVVVVVVLVLVVQTVEKPNAYCNIAEYKIQSEWNLKMAICDCPHSAIWRSVAGFNTTQPP